MLSMGLGCKLPYCRGRVGLHGSALLLEEPDRISTWERLCYARILRFLCLESSFICTTYTLVQWNSVELCLVMLC
jgi:hypothetical protein